MGKYGTHIALQRNLTLIIVMMCFFYVPIFAQKPDTSIIIYKPKFGNFNGLPRIKANVQTYRPSLYNRYPTLNGSVGTLIKPKDKNGKILTILKIYPNPVVEQLNINFNLEKKTHLHIKITDLLGNEIITLSNEKVSSGEQTKTFTMPSKLTSGIYFLRIVAGGEPIIKRISVL